MEGLDDEFDGDANVTGTDLLAVAGEQESEVDARYADELRTYLERESERVVTTLTAPGRSYGKTEVDNMCVCVCGRGGGCGWVGGWVGGFPGGVVLSTSVLPLQRLVV